MALSSSARCNSSSHRLSICPVAVAGRINFFSFMELLQYGSHCRMMPLNQFDCVRVSQLLLKLGRANYICENQRHEAYAVSASKFLDPFAAAYDPIDLHRMLIPAAGWREKGQL
jgi:hypothetical protein